MSQYDADYIVVGSGAAGAAASWFLSSQGKAVICLEQGHAVDRAALPGLKRDWELAHRRAFSPFGAERDSGPTVDDEASEIAIAEFAAVGGATVLFSGHFPRFHPSDFFSQTLDGVGEDWPISYDDLEPFYDLNDSQMVVSGLSGDPAYPPIRGMQPPVPIGTMGAVLGEGFNRLGWHWWPSYSAIATRSVGTRSKCLNAGPCNTGCVAGAKSSVDVSYWPAAMANGVRLETGCKVTRLNADQENRISSVEAVYADGRRRTYRARNYMLACNGIGTPRLLLSSNDWRNPSGLANSSGLVGRGLMLHPLAYVEGRFEQSLSSHHGPQGCSIASHEFYETDTTRNFVRGFSFQALRGPGPVEWSRSLVQRRQVKMGPKFLGAFLDTFDKVACMSAIIEDLREDDNRIELHPTKRDSYGLRLPQIFYKTGQNSRNMLSFALDRGREVMAAAGSVSSWGYGPVRRAGWHLMGTCRMGEDRRTSVVDRFGRSHDHANLFVADSSVFVTSGAVNPTSTLQAVALWVANSAITNGDIQ